MRTHQPIYHPPGWQASFDSGILCKANPTICEAMGETCFYFQENPDGGTISFDSTPQAMLPILQAITFDTWTDPMFDVMDAYSYFACFYFLLIAVLGGMFVINLFLAVIFDEFMRAQASDEAEKEVSSGVQPPVEEPPSPLSPGKGGALLGKGTKLSDGRLKAAPPSRPFCDCAPDRRSFCCGWRYALKNVMLSAPASNISTGFVVFNLVIMCMPYAGQPDSWDALCEGLGSFVTWGACHRGSTRAPST